MKKKPKEYNFLKLNKIASYVKYHFNLKNSAGSCYFHGLPSLERTQRVGVGGWICASYDTWAQASYRTKKTVRKVFAGKDGLVELGLVELIPGDAHKRLATKIRRRNIEELKTLIPRERLNRFVPPEADSLAKKLESISIQWGQECFEPTYQAARTGRIYMSKPNLQNKPEPERIKQLFQPLSSNEILSYSDYSQGEPTILFHALRENLLWKHPKNPSDIYNDLASHRRISRDKAKQALLKYFYSPFREISVPSEWDLPPGHYIINLFNAVNTYRLRLWEIGSPIKGTPRHADTLFSRSIFSNPRQRIHRGTLLAWRIQGTLADIFNSALTSVLDAHDKGDIRFLLQLYDGIYAAVTSSNINLVANKMKEAAQDAGIELETTQKTIKKEGDGI